MPLPDTEFDPDDNFAPGMADVDIDIDAEATTEALVWQLLLLINPGDEDAALQQFSAYQDAQDALADGDDDGDAVQLLQEVIAWKSGFHIAETDPGALIDCLTELVARFNLQIDWGVEDASDDAFLSRVTLTELIETAHDQLRLDGYTLWTWDTGSDAVAGWITLSREDEAMRVLAPALAIDARPGGA
ncbi:MAG: DUF6630 family protein [Luteimonas sp.]